MARRQRLNFIKMKLMEYLKNGDEPSPLHFCRVLKGCLKIKAAK